MKRQNKIFVNIGLTNNEKTIKQITDSLKHNNLFVKAGYKTKSSYKGINENTLVMYINTGLKLSKIIQVLENLCLVCNQESIAARINKNEFIIYSPKFIGEEIKFDSKYFKTV